MQVGQRLYNKMFNFGDKNEKRVFVEPIRLHVKQESFCSKPILDIMVSLVGKWILNVH